MEQKPRISATTSSRLELKMRGQHFESVNVSLRVRAFQQ